MKRLFFTAALLCVALVAAFDAAAQTKQTLLYRVWRGDSLFLDHYAAAPQAGARPCLIFAFGGAFARGSRDAGRYLPFFEFLNGRGIDVVSIDYRLGLKEGFASTDPRAITAALGEAVTMATEDFLLATAFVLSHAQEWGIDPARLIACGSSAGAITVLTAENLLCNGGLSAAGLPAGFDYAGVISLAGALPSMQGPPVWSRPPAPVMLLHGTADSNVPYDTLMLGEAGFYGSAFLARQLGAMGSPCFFYSVENEDHSLSESPMDLNRDELMIFIERMALGGQRMNIDMQVEPLGSPQKPRPAGLEDFIRSNFP